MKIHCSLNRKPIATTKKFLKVEFVFNGGYWAKWYEAKTVTEAKEQFSKEYSNEFYCRTKTY